uniref:Uncharacterized protein n=1 Tax=Chromera velia CCMP2878 TaxID=1169474 RepID=A0A0G4GPL2_9ALVE|eukprot:Cvel_5010.t1-p1 / transcript=Cvel_5010.t1 / gene=Cvel_5010 / organism=Chromera_velia_CCMP2878 / gene_product=hypothetical protein / transcript_product=hypothetical protein / location=Cvel_scaffold227:49434-51389(-) / protein_length=389 / sequence_SO=supercontig / SO=protein_coding / is_pseudo=false
MARHKCVPDKDELLRREQGLSASEDGEGGGGEEDGFGLSDRLWTIYETAKNTVWNAAGSLRQSLPAKTRELVVYYLKLGTLMLASRGYVTADAGYDILLAEESLKIVYNRYSEVSQKLSRTHLIYPLPAACLIVPEILAFCNDPFREVSDDECAVLGKPKLTNDGRFCSVGSLSGDKAIVRLLKLCSAEGYPICVTQFETMLTKTQQAESTAEEISRDIDAVRRPAKAIAKRLQRELFAVEERSGSSSEQTEQELEEEDADEEEETWFDVEEYIEQEETENWKKQNTKTPEGLRKRKITQETVKVDSAPTRSERNYDDDDSEEFYDMTEFDSTGYMPVWKGQQQKKKFQKVKTSFLQTVKNRKAGNLRSSALQMGAGDGNIDACRCPLR